MLVFGILHLVPGDPVRMILGEMTTEEAYVRTRAQLGLDRPLYVQYFSFLAKICRFDFGRSLILKKDVAELLAAKLPNTLSLTVSGLILSYTIGIVFGVLAAVRRNTSIDYLSMGFAIIGVSVPQFWLAFLLIMLFSVKLHWLPIAGYGTFRHLILPAVTLALGGAADVTRMTRSCLLEVVKQDYIQTARAKGLLERTVILKHGLRNALIPIITLLGLKLGWLFGGAVVIEIVFLRPGLGRMLIDAIYMRDFPVVQGVTLILATTVIVGNMLADVLYAVVNPRVQY